MYSVEALMIWYMMYHIISASTDVSCIMKSLRGSEYFTLVLSFKDNVTRINNNRTHMKSVSSFSVSFSNCFACLRSYKKMIIQSMTTSAHTPRNGHKAAYLSAATQKYTHTHSVSNFNTIWNNTNCICNRQMADTYFASQGSEIWVHTQKTQQVG